MSDLDGDGDAEIIHTFNETIHVWDVPNPGNPGGSQPLHFEWPQYGHDSTHSHFYHHGDYPTPAFLRGDADRSGELDIGDVIALNHYLFLGGSHGCLASLDANSGGSVELSDIVWLID